MIFYFTYIHVYIQVHVHVSNLMLGLSQSTGIHTEFIHILFVSLIVLRFKDPQCFSRVGMKPSLPGF